jgi:hypothetical protein
MLCNYFARQDGPIFRATDFNVRCRSVLNYHTRATHGVGIDNCGRLMTE